MKVEQELTKLDEVSTIMKPSSRIMRPPSYAIMGKRKTRFTSREELSDVVLKTLGNPGASRSRRHFGFIHRVGIEFISGILL